MSWSHWSGGFPWHRAVNLERVSMLWCYHAIICQSVSWKGICFTIMTSHESYFHIWNPLYEEPIFQPCMISSTVFICVRSRKCGCLVTWFCYQMIAQPGNKTATPSWPDTYVLRRWKKSMPAEIKTWCCQATSHYPRLYSPWYLTLYGITELIIYHQDSGNW